MEWLVISMIRHGNAIVIIKRRTIPLNQEDGTSRISSLEPVDSQYSWNINERGNYEITNNRSGTTEQRVTKTYPPSSILHFTSVDYDGVLGKSVTKTALKETFENDALLRQQERVEINNSNINKVVALSLIHI